MSGWIAKDADQRGQVERHIEGAFGSRHTTTNHGSQLRSRCWFYVGRKTGEPGEKPSKHGRDQLQQLYSQEIQVFWESTRGGGHHSTRWSIPGWSSQYQVVNTWVVTTIPGSQYPGGHPSSRVGQPRPTGLNFGIWPTIFHLPSKDFSRKWNSPWPKALPGII